MMPDVEPGAAEASPGASGGISTINDAAFFNVSLKLIVAPFGRGVMGNWETKKLGN
jgi:hypothetical protein